ncbi:hypothetical protein ACFLT2_11745 [Acidobacteriota bacterium]
MKIDDLYDDLLIRGDEQLIPEMRALLQSGFYMKVPTGKSLRDILLYCGFSNEFIDSSIKTIFRNSQPVDDIDRTRISEGDVVGLSGSMPGLVGATLRSGSHLAAFRRNISIDPEEPLEGNAEGFIQIRVFNVVLKEAGEFLLDRGIFLKSALLVEFFRGRNSDFFDHCQAIILNGTKVDLHPKNLDDLEFSGDMVFLSVKKK